MMILLLVLIGFAVYYMTKNGGQAESRNKNQRDSVEVLKLRYVSGEIDEETYKRTLKVLND